MTFSLQNEASLILHKTASSQSMPSELKNIPSSEHDCAYSSNLLQSRMSLMHPFPATDCSLETRYDNPGRTCLATQAIAATTLRRQVVSASVHLSAAFLLSPMMIGRILSVLSLAVTLMLMSSFCTTSFPQNLKGASLISRTENVSRIFFIESSYPSRLPYSKSSTFEVMTPTILSLSRRANIVGKILLSL